MTRTLLVNRKIACAIGDGELLQNSRRVPALRRTAGGPSIDPESEKGISKIATSSEGPDGCNAPVQLCHGVHLVHAQAVERRVLRGRSSLVNCSGSFMIIQQRPRTSESRAHFVVRRRTRERRQLIQVCWSMRESRVRERELHALREAMKELRADHGLVVTWMDEPPPQDGIDFVPAWRWLLTSQ